MKLINYSNAFRRSARSAATALVITHFSSNSPVSFNSQIYKLKTYLHILNVNCFFFFKWTQVNNEVHPITFPVPLIMKALNNPVVSVWERVCSSAPPAGGFVSELWYSVHREEFPLFQLVLQLVLQQMSELVIFSTAGFEWDNVKRGS